MARNIRRFNNRGPRRSTDWSSSAPLATFTFLAASTAALLQTGTPPVGGETVIRTRGLVSIQLDTVIASEPNIGAFGIAIVTAQAESVGITAIPHPVTDAAWGGWFVHRFFSNQLKFLSGVGLEPQWATHYEIDSKAMRKIDEDERLVVVVENVSAFGMLIADQFRWLTKLH